MLSGERRVVGIPDRTGRIEGRLVGFGQGENFLASDVPAILEHTRDVVYLEEGELALLTPGGVQFESASGAPLAKKPRRIEWSAVAAEKEGHKHFMHKEIFEQPRAVADTIRGRTSLETGDVTLDGVELDEAAARRISRLVVVACGTSWHAGLAGRTMIEQLARLPVEVELASEFRYRDPIVGPDTLVLAISQSGETADTLAAVKEAKRRGARAVSICNVVGSAIPRECDGTLYTHAGPEIGVASTKGFLTQVAACYLLGLYLAQVRGTMYDDEIHAVMSELAATPPLIQKVLDELDPIKELAKRFVDEKSVLFLGRHVGYPVALEGALKLKEIAYLHAEGFPAGEFVRLAVRDEADDDRLLAALAEAGRRAGDGR